jgi:GNAT superfamily N-acetyltransferase
VAAGEGWNPGLNDAECFWRQDPQGFFGAVVDGQLVGSLSAVRYQGGFAFVGLFLVREPHRGQGLGRALTAAMLPHVSGCVVGLDGVVAQQENYQASGAVHAHRNRRYQGTGGGEIPAGLVDLGAVGFDDLLALDTRCFLAPRPEFLRAWIGQPGHRGWAALGGDGRPAGYGVLRPCRQGFKIGPLFAADPDQARVLARGLLALAPGQPVFLDLPEANPAAVALAEELGMGMVFETARMYLGGTWRLPLAQIFGITSYELG